MSPTLVFLKAFWSNQIASYRISLYWKISADELIKQEALHQFETIFNLA